MRLFLFFCIIGTIVSSCRDTQIILLEDRLEGTWAFTAARQRIVRKPLSTFYSIYSYYDGDQLSFYKDETMTYTEANGDIWDGTWSYYVIDAGEDKTYVLSAVLTNSRGTIQQYVWETNGIIQPNRLVLRSQDSDYEHCFVLWRQ